MTNFHFYGSSVCEWKTSPDVHEVINHFKKGAEPYTLYFVPVGGDAEYPIKWYAPQVEGSVCLGTYKKGKPYQSN